jgi:hypothetical protein
MTTSVAAVSALVRGILVAGLIVGVMDALAAISHAYFLRGTPPAAVWRYVASAVFGKSAGAGGPEMVLWGLLFHLTVAIGWTALFFVAYPRMRFLSANMVLVGMAYGLFVWLMMNVVVVPLTRITMGPIRLTTGTVLMILIHLFVIGVPISYLARRYHAMAH